MANSNIGLKTWRNYSTFSLFGGQREDKNTELSVDTYSGNFNISVTDWNLEARIPCSLSRSYNHLDSSAGVDRPFGPGWSWLYDMVLTGSMNGSNDVTWKAADGSEYLFTYSAGPAWAAPPGMHEYVLTYDGGASPPRYTITCGFLKYIFEVNTTDSRARLIKIEDANSNALEIVRVYSSLKPTAEIDKIRVVYDNSGSPAYHDIVAFTYSGTKVTMLRLLDTFDSTNYIDIHYAYATVDSADRLETVTPKRGSTSLDMELKYGYKSSAGLELEKVYDTNGFKAGTPYFWTINYTASKVSSIVFPIDSTPTTGTVAYDYAPTPPSGWPSVPADETLTKVTDATSNPWWYQHFDETVDQGYNGRLTLTADPLWTNTTHESEIAIAYNNDNQVTEVETPKPNAESGRLTTKYFYNSNKNLAAVVDAYGFVSWYKYGTRASYTTSGVDATVNELVEVYSPLPGTKAYADNDHTNSETTAPSLSSPLNVGAALSYNSTDKQWEYTDGASAQVPLVRAVTTYIFTNQTGKLTQLDSYSPENIALAERGSSPSSLTSASIPATLTFDATTGDIIESRTARQVDDSALGYTEFTYSQIYGVVTHIEAADSITAPPTPPAGMKTVFTYNALHTRVTKVALPEDNTDQWTETVYDDREFELGTKRPDIGSWSVAPQVDVSVYDYNGNLTESWQADPDAVGGSRWNGNTANGYYNLLNFTYDRLNRTIQRNLRIDWDQDTVVETLSTYYTYDANTNLTRVKGPAYDYGGTTYYTYTFTEYDAFGRVDKAYESVRSTNANLTSVPGGTDFIETSYDLVGNVIESIDYMGEDMDFTVDWLDRVIKTSQDYTQNGAQVMTLEQHFDAAGLTYWSADGKGYKHFPHYDLNGRLFEMHRGTINSTDCDRYEYDLNSNLIHHYSNQAVFDGDWREKFEYDLMDRLVNSGLQEYSGSWGAWNSDTANATFNFNGWGIRSYDKVNSGKYTELVYDDWGQVRLAKAPEVPNPAGGNIVYEAENYYDVLGRLTSVDDHMDNTTTFTLDVLGRVIAVQDAVGCTTSIKYDERGLKAQIAIPAGAITSYRYDERGRLDRERVSHDSQDDDTTYAYDDNNRLTQTNFPDGGITRQFYNEVSFNKETQVLLSGANYLSTTREMDGNFNTTETTTPGGYVATFDYDDQNNVIEVIDPNGDDTDMTYDRDGRLLTKTSPNGLIVTNTYDYKRTGALQEVKQKISASSSDDITTTYTLDDNGQVTTVTDPRGKAWVRGYDAMQRMVTLTSPIYSGSSTYTHTITRDGNDNIIKTVDFAGTTHYYEYNGVNQLVGHGTTNTADDETYLYNCCGLEEYTDAYGTATMTYYEVCRLKTETDSQGYTITYEYDEMGRVAMIEPPQGSNYRSEYVYNENGSLKEAKVYDGGTLETTSYTYDTSSGKLTSRSFPEFNNKIIIEDQTYDASGRLDTVTQKVKTTPANTFKNLYLKDYSHSYLTYGSKATVLTKQRDGADTTWNDLEKMEYEYDPLSRLTKETRTEYPGGLGSVVYVINKEYNKNSDLTRYDKNVTVGYTVPFGRSEDLQYTVDNLGRVTAVTDSDDATYTSVLTNDPNLNLTKVEEKGLSGMSVQSVLTTDFAYGVLNRLTSHKTTRYDAAAAKEKYVKREFGYNAIGRLVHSTYKAWEQGQSEPAGDSVEHTYAGTQFVQNADGVGGFGEVWNWAGSASNDSGPLKSPAPDTANQKDYNTGTPWQPNRRTYQAATAATEGDKRVLYAEGRPSAKDASGSGGNWSVGTKSNPTGFGVVTVESRFFFEGTVAPTDLDRATDARGKGRMGIFGTSVSFGGAKGRAFLEPLGRNLNPMYGYAPGTEPPGWNDNLFVPMYAYAPGTEPPGWNDQQFSPMYAYAPGMEPPGWNEEMFTPMFGYAPGAEPPGWNDHMQVPMAGGGGSTPSRGRTMSSQAPMFGYSPGTEPPGWKDQLTVPMQTGVGNEDITIARLPDNGLRQAAADANPANRVYWVNPFGDIESATAKDYFWMQVSRAMKPRILSNGRLCNPKNMSDVKAEEKEAKARKQKARVEDLENKQRERQRPWYQKVIRGAEKVARKVVGAISRGVSAARRAVNTWGKHLDSPYAKAAFVVGVAVGTIIAAAAGLALLPALVVGGVVGMIWQATAAIGDAVTGGVASSLINRTPGAAGAIDILYYGAVLATSLAVSGSSTAFYWLQSGGKIGRAFAMLAGAPYAGQKVFRTASDYKDIGRGWSFVNLALLSQRERLFHCALPLDNEARAVFSMNLTQEMVDNIVWRSPLPMGHNKTWFRVALEYHIEHPYYIPRETVYTHVL